MNFKKHIPNIFTLLNLLCGCVALIFLSTTLNAERCLEDPSKLEVLYQVNFGLAFWFVSLGIFFDFFDGLAARLLNVPSALGKQLDSLADMVTSGVVPGFAIFVMLTKSAGNEILPHYVPYFGFIITLGACLRLAKFNIDTKQTHYFIGLPTPANALCIMSIPLIALSCDSLLLFDLLINPFVLLFISLISFYLMNSKLALFSLKLKSSTIKDFLPLIILAILSVVMIFLWQFSAVPLIIICYILLSLVFKRQFTEH